MATYPFHPKKPKAGKARVGAARRNMGRKMKGPSIGHHKPRRHSMGHHAMKGSY